jgi:AAHS family 3-hydroxyphenylpropionic acid transporter
VEHDARRTGAIGTVALCFAAAMCEGMDVQAAGVAAAGIGHAMSPTPAQLGWFFAAANLGLIVGALVGGRLGDRLGRKPVLTASILLFGACSLATAAAGDMTTLTLARSATGLGLGGAMPNLIALTADATGERARNASIGLTFVGMPVGGAIASLIALALPAGSWRPLFWVGGAAPLLMGLLIAVLLREGRATAGAARPAAAPISELFTDGRLPRTLVLWLGFLSAALTLHLMLNWLPLLLQSRGLTKGDAAAAQVALNLVGAAGGALAGRGLDTRWRGTSVALAIAAVPAALLVVAKAPPAVALMILGAGLVGAGVLALHVILYGLAGSCYPPAIRGTGMGGVVGASRLGALAGPSLAAVLISAGRAPAEVLTSLLPVVLAAGACVVWLSWRPRAGAVAAPV